MTCVNSVKLEGKKLISLLLTLALVFSLVPMTSLAADVTLATFENVTDDGDDVISLTAPRSFKAMIPVSQTVNASDVTWTLTRDASKVYTDIKQFPNQMMGGSLTEWETVDDESFFSDVKTSLETVDGQQYLVAEFSSVCYFGDDISVPHVSGGYFLDACGYFNLNAAAGTSQLGSVALKIVPYDNYRTMAEIYEELDEMVAFAKANTDIYTQKFSMGQSTGDIYEALDMPYIILADDYGSVEEWLEFTELAETDPEGVLKDIAAGQYNDIKVPVLYSNIHANETAAVDGIMEFAWVLLNAAAGDGTLEYNTLTGFTTEGQAQLEAEMKADKIAVPDLVADTATYLGYLKGENSVSGVVDLDKFYEQETVTVSLDKMLEDVFFILVPEENVEGRTYNTRTASNGYDLNRDNSFQTTNETQNMQKLIATFNPVSLTEFHGRVQSFQCEPCDPPHEPNFEYDLLAEHLMTGGEALGIAAVANNDTYNSYVIPQRDYLTDMGGTTYWSDPWDDMSTSYTPQFAMLQGTVAYTVELPAYNDPASQLVQYGCLGQSVYIAENKISYITAQTKIFERGVTNFNSNAFELVGQWFSDQNDVEGAESEIFRPEFDGAGQNGNFYPECYIIPLDGVNQSNLQAANDMMEWLSRNDVKVLVTKSAFTYGGVTYPAGTMIVSMYQAKRSVANGALYDGTLIENWTVLYSEGITTFNETRGFDMVTVAEPASYKTIKAACGDWMDYDDCLEYLGKQTSFFTGDVNGYVVISNASEDSTAAVNQLLKRGKTVSMVDDSASAFYGDFVCTYADWQSVSASFMLSGTGVSEANLPNCKAIAKSPVVYITGPSEDNTTGFVYSSQVSNANWNYDRIALELMGFTTTNNPAQADLIIGASALTGDALTAVQNGTPYVGYGYSRGTGGAVAGGIFGSALVRSAAEGMDCLGYVTYPTTTLVNASYVMDNDDVLYGYGVGYYSAIPQGAQVLVQMDGDKTPTEGFVKAITAEQKASSAAYLNNSVQGFSYQGKDASGNDVNVLLFANSLTHKVHQRDEYAFISNFAFANMIGNSSAVLSGFTDVNMSAWYVDTLSAAVQQGLISGIGDNKIAPNSTMTRSMLVTVLYRMAGSPAVTGDMPFSDTLAGTWYSDAVVWANQQGIVGGYEDGSFGINDHVTREQLAAMLYRYAQATGVATEHTSALGNYTDAANISSYATEAVSWANSAGIISGHNGQLNPTNGATRAEAAAMLVRYIGLAA